jgi:hypothetical protein
LANFASISPLFAFLHLIIIYGESAPAELAILLVSAKEVEQADAIIVQ